MPEAVGSVQIEITGDTSQFEAALAKARTSAANVSSGVKGLSSDLFGAGTESANKLADSFENVEKSAGPLTRILGSLSDQVIDLAKGYLALLSVEKILDFFKESVQLYADQERQINTLEQQLERLGSRTSLTMDDLDKYRESLVATTLATNDQARAAEISALRLGITNETMAKLLTTAQDLAAVNFGDLVSNTELLARAIDNPQRALARFSLRFPEFAGGIKGVIDGLQSMGDKSGVASTILDQLTKSVGGAGAAANTGVTGAFHKLSVAFEEFKVTAGQFIVNLGLDKWVEGFNKDLVAANIAITYLNDTLKELNHGWERLKILASGGTPKMGPQGPISGSEGNKADFDKSAKIFGDAFNATSTAAEVAGKQIDDALSGITDPLKREAIVKSTLAMLHWGDSIGATTAHLQELSQAEKDRETQRITDVASAQLELSLAGKSTEEADAQRKIFQDISALKASLAHEGGISPQEIANIKNADTAIASINQKLRETQEITQLQQEQQALFASDTENKVASALKTVYGDAWPKYLDSVTAHQARLNANLEQAYNLTRSFAGTFVDDLIDGKNAIDSMNDALNALEKQLVSMALDASVKSLFAGLTGGANASSGNWFTNLLSGKGIGGGGGGAGGGGVPAMHTGGYVGSTPFAGRWLSAGALARAPRLHGGLAYDEYPAILQSGERVVPRGGGGGGGGVVVNIHNYNASNVSTQSGRDPSGGPTLDVIIDNMVAGKGNDPTSKTSRMLSVRGARSAPIKR